MLSKLKAITLGLIIGLILSILTSYIYMKFNKFGDYTQIIITGFYTFIPFIFLAKENIKFRKTVFFIISLIIFMPLLVGNINELQRISILLYAIFLSIIFCRTKKRAKGVV